MKKNEIPQRLEKHNAVNNAPIDTHIPFLAGRPQRDGVIDRDDLLNLQIAIYTCKSLEDFLHCT